MRAAVLAVGTELTDGQIINRNAAWISSRVKLFGLRAGVHLSVPDEREQMLRALDFCAGEAEVLFVTGGLGPTSDDLTRDVVAEWAGRPLEFHEASWTMISERLSSRGYPVKEIQRRQAYFPGEAKVLPNSQGTANAFWLRARERVVFVLPGPPREIAAVWEDHLETLLRQLTADLDPLITRTWDTMGWGESQIAELVEPLTADSGFEIGYRVHLPYVEVKLTHRRSQEAAARSTIAKIDEALAAMTVVRDGQDAADELARLLRHCDGFVIRDEVSGLFLLNRLQAALKNQPPSRPWSFRQHGPADESSGTELSLEPVDAFETRIGIRQGRRRRETRVIAPMRSPLMAERRLQYFAEMALLFWLKEWV